MFFKAISWKNHSFQNRWVRWCMPSDDVMCSKTNKMIFLSCKIKVIYVVHSTGCFIITSLNYYCIITITNGSTNTFKRLLSPLHFKTLPPKIAYKFVEFLARTIPFWSRSYFSLSFFKRSFIWSAYFTCQTILCNFQLCLKWQISENAQK